MTGKKYLIAVLGLIFASSFVYSDDTGGSGQFPPHAILNASYRGDVQMVRAILAAGADKDVRDSLGATALHVSVFQQNLVVVRILLENGFDPNVKATKTGNTPLHYAVSINNLDAAKLLLQYGAISNIKNKEGRTALDQAKIEGKTAMVQIFNRF